MASNYNFSKLEKSISECYYTFTIDLSNGYYDDADMEIVAKHVMEHKICKVLVLHHNNITEKGALYLSKALKNNRSVQKLNIGYNKIGDRGVEHIVESLLMSNNTLSKLHLQSNSITKVGAGYLAEMLRNNPTMRKLGLDYNKIGNEGVKLLSLALSANSESTASNNGSPLTALFLDGNYITDEGVYYLADMLKVNRTLTGLALGRNDISDLGVQELIQTLIDYKTAITGINIFSNKKITDKSVDIFVELFDQDRRFKLYKLYDCSFSVDGENKLRMAAERIKGFILLLVGDGFDYFQSYRPQPMRKSSNTTQKSYEDYFSGRRKMFNDKKSERQRVVGSIRCDNRSNSTPDNKIKPTCTNETKTEPVILPAGNTYLDDPTSTCKLGIELLTISVDSSSTPTESPPNNVPNTALTTTKEDNGGNEDAG